MKSGYCLNSKRWLDFHWFGIPSCPNKPDSLDDYMYERCGYYEEKEINYYYKRKMKIIKSYFKADSK